MKTRYLLALFLCCFSSVGVAACSGVMCGGISITKMQVNVANSLVWVETDGAELDLDCAPDSGVFLMLDTSAEGGKNVYSTLLAYKMANKPLNIRVVENSNPCEIMYVVPI